MNSYIEIPISKVQYILLNLEHNWGVTVASDMIEDELRMRQEFFQRLLGSTEAEVWLEGEALDLGNGSYVLRIPIE